MFTQPSSKLRVASDHNREESFLAEIWVSVAMPVVSNVLRKSHKCSGGGGRGASHLTVGWDPTWAIHTRNVEFVVVPVIAIEFLNFVKKH